MEKIQLILEQYNNGSLTKSELEGFIIQEIAISNIDNINSIISKLPDDLIQNLRKYSQTNDKPIIIQSFCGSSNFDYENYIEEQYNIFILGRQKLFRYFYDL